MAWSRDKKLAVGIGVTVGLIAIGVIIWVLVQYSGSVSTDSSTKKLVVTGDLTTASRFNRLPDSCAAITEAQATALGLNPQDAPNILACDEHPRDIPRTELVQHFRFDHDLGKHLYFTPRDSDIIVDLTNVTGEYYSMYLTLENDMFANGFAETNSSSQSLTQAQATSLVEDMVNRRFTALDTSKTVLLQGPATALPCSGTRATTDTLKFNISAPIENPLNTGVDFSTLQSVTVSGKTLNGVLRASFRFLDYTVKLSDTVSTTIRVYLSDCEGKMGDKAHVDSTGTVRWYDYVNDEMVTTRNDNVLTFWNQREAEAKVLGTEAETFNDPLQSLFLTNFSNHLIGMTISVLENFNTDDIKNVSNQITMTLGNTPKVRFRNVTDIPGVTTENALQTIIDNPKYQVMFYDMPDLSLNATLNVN